MHCHESMYFREGVSQKRPPWGNVVRSEIWSGWVRSTQTRGREFQAGITAGAKAFCKRFSGRQRAHPDGRTQPARSGVSINKWSCQQGSHICPQQLPRLSASPAASVFNEAARAFSPPGEKRLADHALMVLRVKFTHSHLCGLLLILLVWINFGGLGELLSVPWMPAMICLAARTLHMLFPLPGTLHGQPACLPPLQIPASLPLIVSTHPGSLLYPLPPQTWCCSHNPLHIDVSRAHCPQHQAWYDSPVLSSTQLGA